MTAQLPQAFSGSRQNVETHLAKMSVGGEGCLSSFITTKLVLNLSPRSHATERPAPVRVCCGHVHSRSFDFKLTRKLDSFGKKSLTEGI